MTNDESKHRCYHCSHPIGSDRHNWLGCPAQPEKTARADEAPRPSRRKLVLTRTVVRPFLPVDTDDGEGAD